MILSLVAWEVWNALPTRMYPLIQNMLDIEKIVEDITHHLAHSEDDVLLDGLYFQLPPIDNSKSTRLATGAVKEAIDLQTPNLLANQLR